MSPTIRTPRRRPRVKSVRFSSLWWIVRREACLRIVSNTMGAGNLDTRREWMARSSTSYVNGLATRLLKADRGRRFWP